MSQTRRQFIVAGAGAAVLANGWIGLFGAGGTPRDILNRIAADTARAVKAPEVIAQFPNWGAEGAGTSPEEFAKRYRDDIAFYGPIIKSVGIQPE